MCDFIEETAAQLLSAGAFKLWRYCVRHKDNEDRVVLSPKMVEKEMKKDQYYRSRDELIEMRYLVLEDRERGVYLLRWQSKQAS